MKRRSFLALASAAAAKSLVSAAPRPFPQPKIESSAAVRFIAFGDAGTGDERQMALGRAMAAYQRTESFDTALLLGDNIYPNGELSDAPAKFERPYAGLLQNGVKFRAVLGNHDVRQGRAGQQNYQHFNMGGRAYYSFTKELNGEPLVEFFALDSNEFDGTQRQWLENALTASKAPWKVAFFHHPLYSSGESHGSNERLRSALEPVLVKYGVVAAFTGHDHIYERTRPQQDVQHFVSGTGGKIRKGDLDRRSPILAYGNDEVCTFMAMEVTAERFSFKTLDSTGRVVDSGELQPHLALRKTARRSIDPRALGRFAIEAPANFSAPLR